MVAGSPSRHSRFAGAEYQKVRRRKELYECPGEFGKALEVGPGTREWSGPEIEGSIWEAL